jgi:hypothetical protein
MTELAANAERQASLAAQCSQVEILTRLRALRRNDGGASCQKPYVAETPNVRGRKVM